MDIKSELLEGIGARIKEIMYGYVARQSVTCTPRENTAAEYFTDFFDGTAYFSAHPAQNGVIRIDGDPLDRSARFALYVGKSPKTVVMIHHFDVVSDDDYGCFSRLAYSPDALYAALEQARDTLPGDAQSDMEGGGFIFGHGVCDMKGGAAIQMALLERIAGNDACEGSLMVVGVPDEEDMSAGMRAAVPALKRIGEEYGLEYVLCINSEPHQRKSPDVGVISTGSIGKLLPFVYVRGRMAHAGKALEGLNPAGVMAEIIMRTEAAPTFADSALGESAPPPTWLFVKDDKLCYDVSMPRAIFGCMSMLTLSLSPSQVMERIRTVCVSAFNAAVNRVYLARQACGVRNNAAERWKCSVMSFGEALREAQKKRGDAFMAEYEEEYASIARSISDAKLTMADAQQKLTEFVAHALGDAPVVIYGLVPPYYPHVDGSATERFPGFARTLAEHLISYADERLRVQYGREVFYTGISDLSYIACRDVRPEETARFMPLMGTPYRLPLEEMEQTAMPCINIGPWGKEFHKLTERVNTRDLFEITPALILEAIAFTLGMKEERH